MAKMGDVKITFEIEPIVKLTCLEKGCVNNNKTHGTCNLKRIVVGIGGLCTDICVKDEYGKSR